MPSFDYTSSIPTGLRLLDGPENIRGLVADRDFKAGEIITSFGKDTVIGLSKSSFSGYCSKCGSYGGERNEVIYCPRCKAMVHKCCFVYHSSSIQCKALSSKYTGVAQNHLIFVCVFQMVLRASKEIHFFNELNFLVSHIDKFRECDDGRYEQFEDIATNILRLSESINFTLEEIVRIACVFAVNSFNILDGYLGSKGMAFDFIIALINHSCVPNTYVISRGFHGDDNSDFILVALKNIKHEDQITMSYTNMFDNLKERTETLNYYFFFSCTCPICNGAKISLSDSFQCPKCMHLLQGLECKCGYRVDIPRYTRSIISTELFRHGFDNSLFELSDQSDEENQDMNISEILICLRKFLSDKDIPCTRQPFVSLVDALEDYYVDRKDNKNLCLLYFAISSRTNLLVDVHMHSGSGIPLFVGRLENFVQCASIYLQNSNTNLNDSCAMAIHSVMLVIYKYLRAKSPMIHCPKVRKDIESTNIPDSSAIGTTCVDEFEAFEYLGRAFLDLVFGRPSPGEYEGVTENYTIAFYMKIVSGCDRMSEYDELGAFLHD